MPHIASKRPPKMKKMFRLTAMYYSIFNPNKLINLTMQRIINNEFGLFISEEILGRTPHSFTDRIAIFLNCWFRHKKYIKSIETHTHDAYFTRFVIRPLQVYMENSSLEN